MVVGTDAPAVSLHEFVQGLQKLDHQVGPKYLENNLAARSFCRNSCNRNSFCRN